MKQEKEKNKEYVIDLFNGFLMIKDNANNDKTWIKVDSILSFILKQNRISIITNNRTFNYPYELNENSKEDYNIIKNYILNPDESY